MAEFGVLPTGFARKPLSSILAEIEESARGVFGAGVIQTPQSPLGQLNGFMASIIATAWEIAEDVYQSYDPGQAEGARLEMLARIRLLERMSGEIDQDFRLAITNEGRASIDLADIERAAAAVSGVTWCLVRVNPGSEPDADGIARNSVCLSALGGDDGELASNLRRYVVPGIGMVGNTYVSTVVAGRCRAVAIHRPTEVRVKLRLEIRHHQTRAGCPPPTSASLATLVAAGFAGRERSPNGADVTAHLLAALITAAHPQTELVTATAARGTSDTYAALPHAISFDEIASVSAVDIEIEVVA